MLRFKRILGLGILAGLLAAAAMAIPAQAGSIKAVCDVVGNAKVTDKDDTNYGVRLTGGSGSFNFESVQLICSGLNKGAPFVDAHLVKASGIYDSFECGRGKAVGVVLSLDKLPFPPPQGSKSNLGPAVVGKKFAVEFVGGGEGLFYWKASDYDKPGLPKLLTSEKAPDKAAWEHAGQIQLGPPSPASKPVPSVPPAPADNCTKSFEVSGEVIVDSDGV